MQFEKHAELSHVLCTENFLGLSVLSAGWPHTYDVVAAHQLFGV